MATWILIAQNSYAAVYELQRKPFSLKLIQRFEHQEGRLKQEELTTDHPGRSKSMVTSGKHGMGQEVSAREVVRKKFIHELCNHIDLSFEQQKFKELILVAPPQFLGELRNTLPKKLHALVSKEITKDFPQWLTEAELSRHLMEDLKKD
jgi:protein required for attachment to host cells